MSCLHYRNSESSKKPLAQQFEKIAGHQMIKTTKSPLFPINARDSIHQHTFQRRDLANQIVRQPLLPIPDNCSFKQTSAAEVTAPPSLNTTVCNPVNRDNEWDP